MRAILTPELEVAIRELKAAIREPTRAAYEAFEARTGLSPCRIEIVLVDVTSTRDERPRRYVADVRIGLDDF